MYLAIQGLVMPRPFRAADRMQQHHAVVGEQLGAFAEEGVVVIDADMLEHADRNDAVERSLHVAIVLQLEARALGRGPFPPRARWRWRAAPATA